MAKEDKTKATKATRRIYDSPESSQSTVTGPQNPDGSEADPCSEEPLMLPPTVSTYSHRVQYIPPPPDSETLRQDLKFTLHDAKKALQDVQAQDEESCDSHKQDHDIRTSGDDTEPKTSSSPPTSSWHEIQGVHILDVVTLAIRAAKIYYTSHEEPQRLYNIKSERRIRQELYAVLDVLKKMASRNFAGGVKAEELNIIKCWVEEIEAFLIEENAVEEQERKNRSSWEWLKGSWEGRERERERLFLCSFLPEGSLPEWNLIEAAESRPTAFLEALQSGLKLVHLHNALLKQSKRQFGDIKVFHTDTAKPYRCAENLRYWIKAAELRWETKLKVNVSGVVNSKGEAWLDFDLAILQWSQAVREDLTKEWKEAVVRPSPVELMPKEDNVASNFHHES